ncbi:MAG: AmmeMemoRadiSam system protein A [Pseudomonadales bacterium]|nr:AmmeMemoRadiSam system protein A [Pseudomonadales bacterium]NIX09415.1 AmmeMemoRadiSam system protein A [Pseudomonadales bacterium]
MAPSPSAEYDLDARRALLGIARDAIRVGLRRFGVADARSVVDLDGLKPELVQPRATFVTLTQDGSLRGCTGSLEAIRPLALDVIENACHSAFRDPRFTPVRVGELDGLRIELSVLSPLEPLPVSSEAELLERLEPSMGLVIEEGSRRGTFLPKVWESLPDPRMFVDELKAKAGFSPGYWSAAVEVFSYRTQTFAEPAPPSAFAVSRDEESV